MEARHRNSATFPVELWVDVVENDRGRSLIGIIRRLDQRATMGESEHYLAPTGQPLGGAQDGDRDIARPRLTNRELEVLNILAEGGRNKDIAEEMTVSIHTVRFHIENLYKKLGVRTRGGLIRVAANFSLLSEKTPQLRGQPEHFMSHEKISA